MHSVLVLWKPILPCATTFTTYGKRLSHVVARISMGYLIDGDDSVMHEGIVRGPTPDPGPHTDGGED